MQYNFGVIGGGSWGTALACAAARAPKRAGVQANEQLFSRDPEQKISQTVLLYTPDENIAREINYSRKNTKYLPEVELCPNIKATTALKNLFNCKTVIIALPSQAFEATLTELKHRNIPSDIILLIATKGMCSKPVQLFSQKIESELTNPYGFISGPNFAKEVAQGKFASITVTSKDLILAKKLAGELASERLYTSASDDIITVQIAGIVKNITAIKSGILKARGEGENAKAWLISQGLKEVALISNALGGKYESLTLPAVIGDLVLTSYSQTSRNTKFGFEFHNSGYEKNFIKNYPALVEGIGASKSIVKYVAKYNLDLPIISSIAELVREE